MTTAMPIQEERPFSDTEASTTILAERLDNPERIKSPRQLMDLPTELLWQILELVVVKPRSLEKYESTIDLFDLGSFCQTSCRYRRSRLSEQPGILRTCRLFRHEGLHLFYSKNIFRSRNADSMLFQALDVIGREQASKMRILIDVVVMDREFSAYDEWMIQMSDLQQAARGVTPSLVEDPWKVRIFTRQSGEAVFFYQGFGVYGLVYGVAMTVGDYSDSTTNWTAVADLAAAYVAKKPSRAQYDPEFYVEEPIAKLMSI